MHIFDFFRDIFIVFGAFSRFFGCKIWFPVCVRKMTNMRYVKEISKMTGAEYIADVKKVRQVKVAAALAALEESSSDEESSSEDESSSEENKVKKPIFSLKTASDSVCAQESRSDEESSEDKEREAKIVNKVNNSTFSLTQSLIQFISRSRAQIWRAARMRRRRRSLSITPQEEKSSEDKDSSWKALEFDM